MSCFNTNGQGLKNMIMHNFGEMLAAKHISPNSVFVSTRSVMFMRDKIETEPLTARMATFSLNHFGPEITVKHQFDGGLFTDDECDQIIAFLKQHIVPCGENALGGYRTRRKQRRTQRTQRRTQRKNARTSRKH